MKMFIFLIIAFFVNSGQLFSQCANAANIYTFTYNSKTYEVVKEMKTWVAAAACAVERKGYLAEINDVNEQNAIYNAIISGAGVSPTYTSVANGGGIAYVWIGATDQQKEGTWIWDGNNDNTGTHFWTGTGASGAPVGGAYHNWGGKSTGVLKEPDNSGSAQHHGAIGLAGWPSGTTILGIAGEWNDIRGSSLIYYIIEKDPVTGINGSSGNINDIFNIYPNPTNGIITFNRQYKSIEVISTTGQLLLKAKQSNSVDLSVLKKNVYFIRIIDDSFVRIEKIIKN